VTMPKVEELTKASLKKTQELDSKIQNAITPAAPGGAGTPGFGAPPAGTGTPPGGAGTPATKGASPPAQ
jgi:hypothetical protein